MEPFEAGPDLVGRTSARLLAAGVDRRERIDALRLLAILDASTDIAGRVRRPLDDLAAEFDLHPLDVIRSIEHLELAGAVTRDGGTVEVLGDRLGGMHLADFLDDVRASFEADDAPLATAAPIGTRTSRWLSRAGAGLVAVAAAAAVVTLAPGPNQTTLQPAAVGSTTTTDAPTTSTTEDDLPGSLVAPSTSVDTTAPVADPPADAGPIVPDTSVVSAACPPGSPTAQVIDDIVRITNPFDQAITVTMLTVGGISIGSPIAVVAGGYADWPLVATLTDGEPAVTEWEYTDPEVARSCAS